MHNRLRGGSNMREAQRLANHIEEVRFSDICGQHEVKRVFKFLVDYLQNPEPFDRLGLTPQKGYLCIGDTRTGKTFAVKALLGEIKAMLRATGRNDQFKFLELSATSINECGGIGIILKQIKSTGSPCIVFIDEIDLLYLQRTGKNDTLSEFLTCMSGALDPKDSKNQVIIIGATNRPENLDFALRQPGRFGIELRFEYPSKVDRINFIKHMINKLSLDETSFDIEGIANNTENKSYEALSMLINNAHLKARIDGSMLTQKYIDAVLDEDLRHIIPSHTKNIPDHEQEILAAHFAGQALALNLLNGTTKLSAVTIKQVKTDIKEEAMGMQLYVLDKKDQKRFDYGKVFTSRPDDSVGINSREEKLNACKFYLAGFAAEEILLGSCGFGCHAEDDKGNALAFAQSIAFQGIDVSKLPDEIQVQKHKEALALVEECKKEISALLNKHKPLLKTLSEKLKEAKTLNAAQIRTITDEHLKKQSGAAA